MLGNAGITICSAATADKHCALSISSKGLYVDRLIKRNRKPLHDTEFE